MTSEEWKEALAENGCSHIGCDKPATCLYQPARQVPGVVPGWAEYEPTGVFIPLCNEHSGMDATPTKSSRSSSVEQFAEAYRKVSERREYDRIKSRGPA